MYALGGSMPGISEQIRQIRELINSPRKHLAISKKATDWYRLCSSLDVIGDTELAFQAYDQLSDRPRPGSSYILVYGFLQALYLQQDAVRNLHEALQVPYQIDPLLKEIREVRNAVAHPTDGGRGKSKTFRFITQFSVNKAGFQLMTAVEDKTSRKIEQISLDSLLNKQHAQLENVLKALLEALQKEEMDYRDRFRDDSLEDLFPETMDYYFEKVYQSARDDSSWEYGKLHVDLVCRIIKNFKDALEKRETLGASSAVEYRLDQLDYALHELIEFFNIKGTGRLSVVDAEIFTWFAQKKLSELEDMAREIDKEYELTPEADGE